VAVALLTKCMQLADTYCPKLQCSGAFSAVVYWTIGAHLVSDSLAS
jgi:hypothetical protein